MSRIMIVIIVVLGLAAAGFGYLSYQQAQRAGALREQLTLANGINKQWQETYDSLERETKEIQQRLDAATERDESNRQYASQQSKLFRSEIDKLKRANNELSQLLDSRIPDSLIVSLCRKGYAAANVCETVLPATR